MLLNKAHLDLLNKRIEEEHALIKEVIIREWQKADDIYAVKYGILYKMNLWGVIPEITWTSLQNFKELQ